ncbi:MAG: GAF domain-containing protein, partial [Armatimonadetes bacterium]|nr:GAF domain-containing protein [Armatimonadota bacterium]
ARYNAFIEGRPIERDILYSLIGTGFVLALYGVVVLALHLNGQASFLSLVSILAAAIISHALYDSGRMALDRLFYQGQLRQLRASLRALAREAGTGQDLPGQLQATLGALCRTLHIQQGFVALRKQDTYVVEAAEGAGPVGRTFPLQALEATESVALPRPGAALVGGGAPPLQDMALLVPLSAGGMQIGALALGAKASHRPYSEADLELLEDLADQMATVIHVWYLQEENAAIINEMVAAFHERERALQRQMQQMMAQRAEEVWPGASGTSEEALAGLVEECLRQIHDFSYLGEHPMAGLQAVAQRLDHRPPEPVTHIDRGKALNQVLLLALHKLRPAGAEPKAEEVPSREWHQYIILHDAYVRKKLTREIMGRLYISEPTFHRTRRRAIRSVAKALREMEQV